MQNNCAGEGRQVSSISPHHSPTHATALLGIYTLKIALNGKPANSHYPMSDPVTSNWLNPLQVPWDLGPPHDMAVNGLGPGRAGVSPQDQTKQCLYLFIYLREWDPGALYH